MIDASDPLLHALSLALSRLPGFAPTLLQRLPDKGLAHTHVRLVGCGVLARVPKQSQMGLAAQANLDYQTACFQRASASGHAPRLVGRVEPTADGTPLQWGALLVQEIVGKPAALPADLPALVDALAAIHRLPLPPAQARAPLMDEPDALLTLQREIAAHAQHLDAAKLQDTVRADIETVRTRWQRLLAQNQRPPRRLITFDAHPGNFIVSRPVPAPVQGTHAVIVDLEKARYSHPPLDLAHLTLFTSTTWDVDSHAELSLQQVVDAYERWLQAMASTDGADPAAVCAVRAVRTVRAVWRPWLAPLREAMWLWAVTWCAKWRVQSGAAPRQGATGEDWSAARSDAALIDHVRGRVDEYLSPRGVTLVVRECDALRKHFGAVLA